MSNILPNISGTETLPFVVAVLNQVVDFINASQRTTVFNDGVTDRYLVGYQKDGWGPGEDFGIKVSKEGVDVKDAADADLIFKDTFDTRSYFTDGNETMQIGVLRDGSVGIDATNGTDMSSADDLDFTLTSRKKQLQVALEGTAQVTKPANSAVAATTVTHNLGVKPKILADGDNGTDVTPLPVADISVSSGSIDLKMHIEDITDTQFTITVITPSTSPLFANSLTVDFKWQALVETAA